MDNTILISRLKKLIEDNENEKSSSKINEFIDLTLALIKNITEENEKEINEIIRITSENVSDIIWQIGTDTNIIYISPSVETILGYSTKELFGTSFLKYISIEDRPTALENMKRRLTQKKQAGQIYNDYRMITKSGKEIAVEVSSEPLYNKKNELIGYSGVTREISVRKEAEQKLAESEKKYRILLENSGAGIGYYDPDGNLIIFNKLAASYLNGQPEDFIGKNVVELFGEKNGAKYLKRIKEATMSSETIDYHDNISIEGTEYWFSSKYTRVFNSDNKLEGIQIISHDITEKKQAEIELFLNEKRFKQIIDHSSEMFYIHDTNHVLQFVSSQCFEFFGYKESEMKIKWTELTTDNPLNIIGIEKTELAISTGKKQKPYQLELKHKNGSLIWVEVDESPFKNSSGVIEGIVGAIRNITEEKKAIDALILSEERYRLLFEKSIDPNLILLGERFTDANQAAVLAFGFQHKNELIDLHPADISPEFQPDGNHSRARSSQIIHTAYKDGYVHFEWLHVDTHGNEIWFDISLTRFGDASEKKLHVAMRNINESILAKEELLKANRLLEETGSIAKIGGWEFEAETFKGTWTREVAMIHELDSDPPINLEAAINFYTDDSKKLIKKAIDKVIKNGTPYDLELELITARGNRKWIRTIGHPVYKNNKVVKITGSFQDITEKKQIELEIMNYRDHLQELVKERTAALEEKNEELERMNNLFVGREFRIKDLRNKIEELKNSIEALKEENLKMKDKIA